MDDFFSSSSFLPVIVFLFYFIFLRKFEETARAEKLYIYARETS